MREYPKLADPQKPCDGCAHSAVGVPFPGCPSGERPCSFCIRNPRGTNPDVLHPSPEFLAEVDEGTVESSPYVEKARKANPGDGIWYDGTPAHKTPMDCYVTVDRMVAFRHAEQALKAQTS